MAAAKSLVVLIMLSALLSNSFVLVLPASNFYQDFDIIWGIDKVRILNDGEVLNLYLGKDTGSGFQSKNEYLFGKIDMQFKLVPGNSAGTPTFFIVLSPNCYCKNQRHWLVADELSSSNSTKRI
ncbi:hypothetical protein CUMW_111410 [Citrus unshiu]|nr:hypothetical protein CUMW_111410 [Citrus unshiu]